MNPVSLALEQELGRFMQSIKGNAAEKENVKRCVYDNICIIFCINISNNIMYA